jgi:hypothetical protein
MDREGAAQALAEHAPPAHFLDFETIAFAVPIWKGTRPYEQIPFQFSVHRLGRRGGVEHRPFLDLTGDDPSRALAQELIAACDGTGPIFVYNASFESACIAGLAARLPRLRRELEALRARLVDLYPVVRRHFYHPSQQGSWSMKAVLPAMVEGLDYANLDGVADGGMAAEAYSEAIAAETSVERKAQLRDELLTYCKLDTYGLLRIWQTLTRGG